MLRKVLLLTTLLPLLVLVGLLSVGDVAAKRAAESAVEDAVRSKVAGVGEVQARIHSFPFIVRLVAAGQVPRLDLRLSDVTGHGIDVGTLDLDIKGLELNRGVLFGGGDVKIAKVDGVQLDATIAEAAVRKATGADIHLLADRATVTVGGKTADAAVTVVNNRIQLTASGWPPVSLPLPDVDLLPCPVGVRSVPGALIASCSADHLPQTLLDAVGSVELEQG